MNCKYCGAQINDGEKFCSSCGMPVESSEEKQKVALSEEIIKCKYCGEQLNSGDKFCPACGMQVDKSAVQTIPVSAMVTQDNSRSTYDTVAIVSMILSIIGLLCCGMFLSVPGLITGIIGLKSQKNKGFAIAAIIIGVISILMTIITAIFYSKYFSELSSQFMDPDFFNEFMNEFGEINT